MYLTYFKVDSAIFERRADQIAGQCWYQEGASLYLHSSKHFFFRSPVITPGVLENFVPPLFQIFCDGKKINCLQNLAV
jgi:hypothetical protein